MTLLELELPAQAIDNAIDPPPLQYIAGLVLSNVTGLGLFCPVVEKKECSKVGVSLMRV